MAEKTSHIQTIDRTIMAKSWFCKKISIRKKIVPTVIGTKTKLSIIWVKISLENGIRFRM